MSILISTNMYQGSEFERVFDILDSFPAGALGIEVFPMFHEACFEGILKDFLPRLQAVPVSFHGPYYQTEHSAPKGSDAYLVSMEYLQKTLSWARQMNCRYLVFHHNNCRYLPENKPDMMTAASKNLAEITALASSRRIPVVVENAGVKRNGNMLLDQKEFTCLCKALGMPVLVDIGHAHANDWDISRLIMDLKDQIISYHIHNNDGSHDNHKRIFDGTMDFYMFLQAYKTWTPEADLVIEYGAATSDDVDGIVADVRFLLEWTEGIHSGEMQRAEKVSFT